MADSQPVKQSLTRYRSVRKAVIAPTMNTPPPALPNHWTQDGVPVKSMSRYKNRKTNSSSGRSAQKPAAPLSPPPMSPADYGFIDPQTTDKPFMQGGPVQESTQGERLRTLERSQALEALEAQSQPRRKDRERGSSSQTRERWLQGESRDKNQEAHSGFKVEPKRELSQPDRGRRNDKQAHVKHSEMDTLLAEPKKGDLERLEATLEAAFAEPSPQSDLKSPDGARSEHRSRKDPSMNQKPSSSSSGSLVTSSRARSKSVGKGNVLERLKSNTGGKDIPGVPELPQIDVPVSAVNAGERVCENTPRLMQILTPNSVFLFDINNPLLIFQFFRILHLSTSPILPRMFSATILLPLLWL